MKDVNIIIPLHVFNDDVKKSLEKAIGSVPEGMPITISTTKELIGEISNFAKELKNDKINVVAGKKSNKSDFCSLVNEAVKIIDEKWFSILEYDDTYTKIWFDNVEKYSDEFKDISVFMPIADIFDFKSNKFVSFANEVAWASSFSNEIGYIDFDCLENFFNFNMTGSVFNTDDWTECGGLKSNIKLSFWYEFLLRTTSKGKKVLVIPKVGYVHFLGRDNSLMDFYSKNVEEDEANFWFKTAKEEYKNMDDKEIEYKKKE